MARKSFQELNEVIAGFDHVMLVTERDGELRSRPMAIADFTDDGRIRFITRDDSSKLEELDEDDNVNVAAQGDGSYLSLSGRARLTKDESLIDRCWHKRQERWFSEGKDDPHVILLEVVPTYAEYWERSETTLSRLLPGEDAVEEDHGEVDLRSEPL